MSWRPHRTLSLARWGAALDAARLVGPHGDLDAVPGAELSHEAREVGLGGAEADVELVGNLGIGPTEGYDHQDLLFAVGQRFDGLSR